MVGLQRFAIVGVVAAGIATAVSIGDRRPIDRFEPPVRTPFVLGDDVSDVRKAELNRRAERPINQKTDRSGFTYDQVLEGWKDEGKSRQPKPAEPMPPTFCKSIEPAPRHPDKFEGPHRLHHVTVSRFKSASGFGFVRGFSIANRRGVHFGDPAIDRVELVSLLTDYEPSVYVLDEMPTPPLAMQAKRRPLDEFERLGLDAVRRGEDLIWTPEAPTRMFGAIRAEKDCLECHANAKKGDLLGAFTYYLYDRVDRVNDNSNRKPWRASSQ